jgi:hypothetical protein
VALVAFKILLAVDGKLKAFLDPENEEGNGEEPSDLDHPTEED